MKINQKARSFFEQCKIVGYGILIIFSVSQAHAVHCGWASCPCYFKDGTDTGQSVAYHCTQEYIKGCSVHHDSVIDHSCNKLEICHGECHGDRHKCTHCKKTCNRSGFEKCLERLCSNCELSVVGCDICYDSCNRQNGYGCL